ncbi:MAG: hypothetical protein J6O40_02340 [Ruminococcus sp.]|nr:hypothetical protein [Ruminococcus sp.]
MNEKLESYIKDLPDELKEKARACKTAEDYSKFLEENDLELPDEALSLVAGGVCTKEYFHNNCPNSRWPAGCTYQAENPVNQRFFCTVCRKYIPDSEATVL